MPGRSSGLTTHLTTTFDTTALSWNMTPQPRLSLLPLILPHYLGTWPHSPGHHYYPCTTALSWNMTPQPRFAEAIQVHHFARSRAEWHFATPSELKPKIVNLFFQHPPSTIPFTKHVATIFFTFQDLSFNDLVVGNDDSPSLEHGPAQGPELQPGRNRRSQLL